MGRAFTIDGMTWFRIVNGKIVESLANEDTLGMLIQLGVIPSQSTPPPADTTKENETLVGRYFNEVLNQGKLEVVDEIAAA